MFLIGGWLRSKDLTVFGNSALEIMSRFHVDKAFIGGAAITAAHGLMDYFDEEVNLRKAMIKAATETFLLVDHTKFGKSALFTVTPADSLSAIITDDKAPPEEVEALRKMGVRVMIAACPRDKQEV